MEVHHINPLSEGGKNNEDNAIALCLDCHADAGHYNKAHPKGTKLSPEELKLARDEWHDMVKRNEIAPSDNADCIHARYLLCQNYEAIREICDGFVVNLPVEAPFLFQNDISRFQKKIIASNPKMFKRDFIYGKTFKSEKSYLNSIKEYRTNSKTNYYNKYRSVSYQELHKNVAKADAITSLLLNSKVPAGEIAMAYAYYDACGEDSFQEFYQLRPLWAMYLAISNTSDKYISIYSLDCKYETAKDINYRPFKIKTRLKNTKIKLPSVGIRPKSTIIIPIATLLGPLNGKSPELLWRDNFHINQEQTQTVSHGNGTNLINETSVIGPRIFPISIHVSIPFNYCIDNILIHPFDLSNLYTIDRDWCIGSCPHLFF